MSGGFEAWAIVELFGHQRIAGAVSEAQLAGTTMLRVDVPEVDGLPAFTRYYGGGAVYGITPTTETIARRAAAAIRAPRVPFWLPDPERALPAGSVGGTSATEDQEEGLGDEDEADYFDDDEIDDRHGG